MKKYFAHLPLTVVTVFVLALICRTSEAITFQSLGSVYDCRPIGLSADGSVVVGGRRGSFDGIGPMGFRWTSEGGMVERIGSHSPTLAAYVTGVSADGTVVVGTHRSNAVSHPLGKPEIRPVLAFRWTSEEGTVILGDLPGGRPFSVAWGVSADGSVIVGQSESANGLEAFRWTSETGMVGLGILPGYTYIGLNGVSADGSVIVGHSYSDGNRFEAFRWTSADGMVGFGAGSSVAGVSANGSVVVGASGSEAFRWTSAGGMVNLGALPGDSSSGAHFVSADGSVVIGTSGNSSGSDDAFSSEIFRWTSAGGMVGLGISEDSHNEISLLDVSEDGSVFIVDFYDPSVVPTDDTLVLEIDNTDKSRGSYLWDATNGARPLDSVLADSGIDLSEWSDLIPTALSADGTAIVGRGIHNGYGEIWLVTGLAVPEPGTWALLLCGGLWMLLGLRKHRPVQE